MKKQSLLVKIIFVGQILGIVMFIFLILYAVSGAYETKNILTYFLPLSPLAGSGILAVVISEIIDKRREKRNEDKNKKND